MKPATIYKLRARIAAMRAQLEDMDRVLELMLPRPALAAKRAKPKRAKKAPKRKVVRKAVRKAAKKVARAKGRAR